MNIQKIIDSFSLEGYEAKKVDDKTYDVYNNGELVYTLRKKGDKFQCDCTGFKYRGTCKHLKLLDDLLPKRFPIEKLKDFLPEIEKIKNLGVDYEIVGSYRRGKCFAKGTLVRTVWGKVPIEEIKEGDLVFNGWGEITEVTKVFRGKSEDWARVGVRRKSNIVCTSEHKFLVFKENSPRKNLEWEFAKDLGTKHWKLTTPKLKLPTDTSIGIERAFILGWYLADGNLHWYQGFKEYRVRYLEGGFHHVNLSANSLRVKPLLHLIAELGFRNFSFHSNEEDNSLSINVRDESLIEFILEWGGFHSERMGKEKYPDDRILRLPEDEKKAFLQGFWLGDGSFGDYQGSKTARFYNTNYRISVTVNNLLSCFYKTLDYKREYLEDYKTVYETRLTGESLKSFIEEMPEYCWNSKYTKELREGKFKKDKTFKKQFEGFASSVRDVEIFRKEMDTFCFEVKEGESFIVDNYVVHNSTFKDIDLMVRGTLEQFQQLEQFLKDTFGDNYTPIMSGDFIIRGWLTIGSDKVQLDINRIIDEDWIPQLLYRTGPKDLNMYMRSKAKQKGWKLNEHGIFDENGKKLPNLNTEQDYFEALGLRYLTPQQREDFRKYI